MHRSDRYPDRWPDQPAAWITPRGMLAAWVARLFTAPDARHAGLGGALLDTACARARDEGRWAVLDVMDSSRDAIAMYERRGWRRLGHAHWDERADGRRLYSYVAPSRPGRAATLAATRTP